MNAMELMSKQRVYDFTEDPVARELYEQYKGEPFEMMLDFYLAGVVRGKRIERARKRKTPRR